MVGILIVEMGWLTVDFRPAIGFGLALGPDNFLAMLGPIGIKIQVGNDTDPEHENERKRKD